MKCHQISNGGMTNCILDAILMMMRRNCLESLLCIMWDLDQARLLNTWICYRCLFSKQASKVVNNTWAISNQPTKVISWHNDCTQLIIFAERIVSFWWLNSFFSFGKAARRVRELPSSAFTLLLSFCICVGGSKFIYVYKMQALGK